MSDNYEYYALIRGVEGVRPLEGIGRGTMSNFPNLSQGNI